MWPTLQPDITNRLPRRGINGVANRSATAVAVRHVGGANASWEQILNDLLALGQLGPDWDGQGAAAPSTELLESARALTQRLLDEGVEAPSCVVAGVNGTVLFEWQAEDGEYAELEVTQPYRADAYWMAPGQPTLHWEIA